MKQIMYGVTDFALIRAENGYFVDRTALIRELERTRYALFLPSLPVENSKIAFSPKPACVFRLRAS